MTITRLTINDNEMKHLLALMLTAVLLWPMAQTATARGVSVGAFVCDSDSVTNLRAAPGGKVVMRLVNRTSYMMNLSSPRDGWWQVDMLEDAEQGEEIALDPKQSPTGQYWIHHSVVGVSTRNYGGRPCLLRAAPGKRSPVAYGFNEELTVHPLDARGDWVKVKTPDGHIGWIEVEMLCDNPLTTCP